MAEKPPEEGFICVVDEEPEFFQLLKWDTPQTHKQTHHHHQPQQPTEVMVAEVQQTTCSDKSKRLDYDPFDSPDTEFLEKYRLPKLVVKELVQELQPVMPDSVKFIEFSVESKLLAALTFFATGKYQKTPSKSDPNTSLYFASTAVAQITEALNHPSILKKYLHFPHLRQERDVIKSMFYMKYGIPSVLGCIDCTHVPIARPENDTKSHFNKSYHSKKVQIISDASCRILSADASSGGAASHDAVLQRHALRVDLVSLNRSGEPCWLLGSSQYSQQPYLMVPYPKISKKSVMSPEKHYTMMHSTAHSCVTETIKQLKSRWKCLQATRGDLEPTAVEILVKACAVLHNLCLDRGIQAPAMTPAEERLEAVKQKVANTSRKPGVVPDEEVRANLTRVLWQQRSAPEVTVKKRSRKERLLESQSSTSIDNSKRPRPVMPPPNYAPPFAPTWSHYPQH